MVITNSPDISLRERGVTQFDTGAIHCLSYMFCLELLALFKLKFRFFCLSYFKGVGQVIIKDF